MSKRPSITFANSQPDLPGSDFAERLKELRIQRLFAANSNQRNESTPKRAIPHAAREPTMVEQEHPHPRPRPSMDIADEVDAASHTARLETERARVFKFNQTMKGQHMSQEDDTKQRPQETLREGSLKAAIWRNEGENGPYHSVTVSRTYKDRDGNLQDTQSFRPKDLLGLSELARRAHHNANEHEHAAFKERRTAQKEQSQNLSQGHSH
ncbi:MAG: hypothetical protein AAGB07_00735 [Pseudomonadota bacterium]